MRLLLLLLIATLVSGNLYSTTKCEHLPSCAVIVIHTTARCVFRAQQRCVDINHIICTPLEDLPVKLDNWGLDRINQATKNLDGVSSQITGDNEALIYVIDGALDTSHPEIMGRVSQIGTPSSDTGSCTNHATSVVSIIIGDTVGVWPEGLVHHVNAFGCGTETTLSAVLMALDVVIEHRTSVARVSKKAVVNMSFGFGKSQVIDDLFADVAAEHSITFITSAGNSAADACDYTPAASPAVITVAAIDEATDNLSEFSNRGACVDILAPGNGVRAAYPGHVSGYALIGGTSIAAPFVTAVVAGYYDIGLTSSVVIDIVSMLTIDAQPSSPIPSGTTLALVSLSQLLTATQPGILSTVPPHTITTAAAVTVSSSSTAATTMLPVISLISPPTPVTTRQLFMSPAPPIANASYLYLCLVLVYNK